MKATITTNKGAIVLELDAALAPDTCANFKQYADDGHYSSTIFHRVIPGFMIQGGGFDENMDQKPTRANIKNEAANGLKNDLGTIAMARTPDPHSASSQSGRLWLLRVRQDGGRYGNSKRHLGCQHRLGRPSCRCTGRTRHYRVCCCQRISRPVRYSSPICI